MWYKNLSKKNKQFFFYGISAFALAIISLIVGLLVDQTPITEICGCLFMLLVCAFIVLLILFIKELRIPLAKTNGISADVDIAVSKHDHFYLNSNTKEWQVLKNGKFSKAFKFSNISEFSFNKNDEILYKKSMSAIPMIAGGMLFGGLGALAGSLINNSNQKIKVEEKYTIYISTNDIANAGIILECTKESMFQLAKTFELLEKEMKQK